MDFCKDVTDHFFLIILFIHWRCFCTFLHVFLHLGRSCALTFHLRDDLCFCSIRLARGCEIGALIILHFKIACHWTENHLQSFSNVRKKAFVLSVIFETILLSLVGHIFFFPFHACESMCGFDWQDDQQHPVNRCFSTGFV